MDRGRILGTKDRISEVVDGGAEVLDSILGIYIDICKNVRYWFQILKASIHTD
jgi:hypothetical protein